MQKSQMQNFWLVALMRLVFRRTIRLGRIMRLFYAFSTRVCLKLTLKQNFKLTIISVQKQLQNLNTAIADQTYAGFR